MVLCIFLTWIWLLSQCVRLVFLWIDKVIQKGQLRKLHKAIKQAHIFREWRNANVLYNIGIVGIYSFGCVHMCIWFGNQIRLMCTRTNSLSFSPSIRQMQTHNERSERVKYKKKTIKDLEQSPMATAYFQSLILLKR